MRILIAPQEFKGSLTAIEAAQAIAAGVSARLPEAAIELLPLADGGPGTIDVLLSAQGGKLQWRRVLDPLLRPVSARWLRLPDGTAVIECAQASGLWRLREGERDARTASSYGTGQLVMDAIAAGCSRLIIGLGGSATNDGGAGLAQALGYHLFDTNGDELPPGGAALAHLSRIQRPARPLPPANVIGATDVTNVLTGPTGASRVYGPQKGANAAAVSELDAALEHFAAIVKRDLGPQLRGLARAGAAGGLGAGLVAFLGAELTAGAALVADAVGLAGKIANADLVITGEGSLDLQTLAGKTPLYVAEVARAAGKPVACLAGVLGPGHEGVSSRFDFIEVASSRGEALPSRRQAAHNLAEAAERLLSVFQTGMV